MARAMMEGLNPNLFRQQAPLAHFTGCDPATGLRLE